MFYLIKPQWWLKTLYNNCLWSFPSVEKNIYLTFDDGPHPEATPFVLNELKKHNAKATFFCIGQNVEKHNDIYQQIIQEGHNIGNHTYSHLNGWKTENKVYINDIDEAGKFIHSGLFRPPYGKIKRSQLKLLKNSGLTTKIIMWSILSGDFDVNLPPERCLQNVLQNAENGSIIVYHDSEKAYKNLVYSLPVVLEYFSNKGFSFEKIVY
jgi:peptidoglycan-N-acetylglucosamine deacetylase